MSSSSSSPKSASRHPPAKLTPLAERSQSQTNRPSLRLLQDSPDEDTPRLFSPTPFPTKPAHVLLPSTIRERRLGSNDENTLPALGVSGRHTIANTKAKRLGSDITPEGRAVSPPLPTLTLKRSVKTLRDLYEAQAERSRPSTATSPLTSPLLRPSTASSGLRSYSSRDGLKGPQAWELFHKAYSDEVGTLPSLDEVAATVRQIESQTSLTEPEAGSSSPNLLTYETPSSPPPQLIQESSSPNVDILRPSSTSGDTAIDSSSPNVVRLAGSSSPTATSAEPSSPIVVKLGSSSPSYKASNDRDLVQEFDESPDTIRRDRILARVARIRDGSSFAERVQDSEGFDSSPPDPVRSSPTASSAVESSSVNAPCPASSPPFESVTIASEHSNESAPVSRDARMSSPELPSQSHLNLQVAIGSSPAPSLQYPTVRAPRCPDRATLNVAKRLSRSMTERYAEKWDPRLSAVPSEWSGEKGEASLGPGSIDQDSSTYDTSSDDDSFLQPPARAYLASSREPSGSTIRIVSDADRREATDFIADLRPSEYRSLPLQPRASVLSILSSSGSRSNSLRNSAVDARLGSMLSYTSSRHSSITRSIRRPGSSSSLVSNLPLPTWARRYYSGGVPKDYFYSASQISSTTNLTPRPSTAASRSTIEHVTNIFRPRTRPRLPNVQQSHQQPGMGPLVSHPFTPKSVSIGLDPADPRAHWAGVEGAGVEEAAVANVPNEADEMRPHSAYRPFPNRQAWSPHLHQDYRYGLHPRRSLWHAPSMNEKQETIFNWRNAQVLGFILGFVFPLSWLVAAFLPLPPKPNLDMEQISRIPTPNVEARLQQKMDIADDIRYENARWWRGLNRIMCAVGVVIIVLVVTLAVVFH